jgi:TonB family protein
MLALHAASAGAGSVKVRGAGKLTSVLVVLAAICVASNPAFGQSQPQTSSPADQAESAGQQDAPVHVAQGVTAGLLIKRVNPKYPGKAREERIQGTVVLRALISKDGNITDLSVVSGDPLLVKSATKVVKQWKYRPYLLAGKPVAVNTLIMVNFTLSGG